MIPLKRWMIPPGLALCVALALVTSAQAQAPPYQSTGGVSASLHVRFGGPVHWSAIAGTRIEEPPMSERPDYDVFRYGGTFYAYNNNRWYSSPTENGEFAGIDSRSVPGEFSSIPREHWHNYPASWQDRQNGNPDNQSTTLQVNLGSTTQWSNIGGTTADELPASQRPNFDVFRSGGTYYAHQNDRWYMSRQESGQYDAMDDRDVPATFSRIPREHWQSYPAGWMEHPRREASPASMEVNFETAPHWRSIRGTRVQRIRKDERPDYDMFRYAGDYYVYSNDRWFMSHRRSGPFGEINERAVPSALYRVPRRQWQNYPTNWNDQNGDPQPSSENR